jgi:hypothetical protein
MHDEREQLREQVGRAARHLLSQQDRDPESPTRGCFDRRFWAWKLVDFPEATYQRNVYPLAWLLRQPGRAGAGKEAEVLAGSVRAGLAFALAVQHRDGSFDQAFPNERSFGATAFLLHPLLAAYEAVRGTCEAAAQERAEAGLRRAADFLCRHDETHGHIANHLAGAALSLAEAARAFDEAAYAARANEFVRRIRARQSAEGWFQEYEGADPGYQTLCLYYLASYHRLRPDPALREALARAVAFLAWFVHPDGSFAGEYGSRRTALFYPGGIALLSHDDPLARRMLLHMLRAARERRTTALADVDFGNYAPLLANYVTAVETDWGDGGAETRLPCEAGGTRDFPEAGLFVRSTPAYYAVFGASNGGVLKVFDRRRGCLLWNDGGYVGRLRRGPRITTQATRPRPPCAVTPGAITLRAPFYRMAHATPSPLLFLVLRALNLTLMRSIRLGNLLKGLMVRRLITGKKRVPLEVTRTVTFGAERVVVRDRLHAGKRLRLEWLACGRPFVSIHMASARYFESYESAPGDAAAGVDVGRLHAAGTVEKEFVL